MGATRREVQTSGDLVMAPRVPHGLAAAVEGLTREVIRHRPEDIYDFAAHHFEQLLNLRDQYGAATNLPGRSGNTAALREMNRSLKQRYAISNDRMIRGSETNEGRRGVWSMNETAKVMERHRSIFGDEGRRMSPEEVRALANEKENKSLSGKSRTGRRTKSRGDLETIDAREHSSERYAKRLTKEGDKKSKTDSSAMRIDSDGAPILMTRIGAIGGNGRMLAKDIKSELRKNRNGSRDGRGKTSGRERNDLELDGTRVGIGRRDDSARRSDAGAKWRWSGDRSETDNQKYKTETDDSEARIPRALSMDRVRDSVVKKFRSSESWDELVSTNYVDKVQEVIDESAPTIRYKVKELSSVVRSRQEGCRSVEESTSTLEKSNQTEDVGSRSAVTRSKRSRKSAGRKKSVESRGNDSLEGIETLASEVEVRGSMMDDARNEVKDISTTRRRTRSRQRLVNNGRASGDSDASDYLDVPKKLSGGSNLSLPAVRPPSSRNTSRSVSRSDSDNLILPPISPEAVKPAKQKETLVLPCLSPSTGSNSVDLTTSRTAEAANRTKVTEIGEPEDPLLFEDAEEPELNLPDAPTDEIFKDSLNVTPEIGDAPPRPDSLEPVVAVGEMENGENNVAGEIGKEGMERGEEENNTVIMKLMEIEETEKRIEQIFRCEEKSDDIEEYGGSMRGKLMEIEAVEKRIESAFHSAIMQEPREGDLENVEVSDKDRQGESSVPGIFVDEAGAEIGSAKSFARRKSASTDVKNERKSTVRSDNELRYEEVSSRTSDSMQNSYILTEGSPFDVPDSVSTVIIAENQLLPEGFESGVEKIKVDENTEDSVGFDESRSNSDDKLVKVIESVEESGAEERADFLEGSKASSEMASRRQYDVGQELAGGDETRDEKNGVENEEIGIGEAKISAAIASDRAQTSDSSRIEEEITGARTEVLQKYVATDSPSTGSSDEVKETTISDDGGISGAESSVTSQFCEDTDLRNSESSNEVKETTISDRPAENAGQNLYNLAPRCYGSMPQVPELNLDSLQDITVSSFQLSDDAATKEDSATSQESSENATSFTEIIEDGAVGVDEEIIVKEQVAIREDPCVKIQTYVVEPNTEISKRDAVDSNPGVTIDVTASPTVKVIDEEEETPVSGESATKQLPQSNRFETDSLRDFEDLENRVTKMEASESRGKIEIERTDTSDNSSPFKLSDQILVTVDSEDPLCSTITIDGGTKLDDAIVEDKKRQGSGSMVSGNTNDPLLLSSSRSDDSKSLVARSVVPKEIDVTSAFGDIVVAESVEYDADDENPVFNDGENVDSSLPFDSSVLLVSETPTEAETVVSTANLQARSSESSVAEIIDKNNSSTSVFPKVLVPAEGILSSTSARPVTTGSLNSSEDPKLDLSSAPSGGTSSNEPPDTKETASAPSIVERPEGVVSSTSAPPVTTESRDSPEDPNLDLSSAPSGGTSLNEPPNTKESASALSMVERPEGVVSSTSPRPVTTESRDSPEDSKFDLSSAPSGGTSLIEPPNTKESASALSMVERPEGVVSSTSLRPVTTESRDSPEDPKLDLSSAPSGGTGSIEPLVTEQTASAPGIVERPGVVSSTSPRPVTTESRDSPEDPKFDLSSANSCGTSSIEPPDTKETASAPGMVERPEGVVSSTSVRPVTIEPRNSPEDPKLGLSSAPSGGTSSIEPPDTKETASAPSIVERPEGVLSSTSARPVTTESLDSPEDPKFDLSSANSCGTSSIEPPDTEQTASAPGIVERPEGVVSPTSPRPVTTESRNPSEDPKLALSSAPSVGTSSNEPPDTKETASAPSIVERPEAPAPCESAEPKELVASESPLSETLYSETDETIVVLVSENPVSIESPDAGESTTAVVLEVSNSSVPHATVVSDDSTSLVAAVPLPIVSPDKLDPNSLEVPRLIVPPEKEVHSRSVDSDPSRAILSSADGSNEPVDPEIRSKSSQATIATKDDESVTSEVAPTPILPARSDEFGRKPDHDDVEERVDDPPRAEIVTNDLDGEGAFGERLEYHIYVPEVTGSEESSTTESSTFNSAATKIQAGVRGFLTRRRLQSAQRRSSTLDSVPSIQDSFTTDATHLEPIEELGLGQAATTIQSNYRGYKARQRLRREDAVQKTTLSVENAFLENGLQHTGEFHDCLPLPTLEAPLARIDASASPGAGIPDDAATASSSGSRSESVEIGSDFPKFTAEGKTGVVDGNEEDSDYVENRVVTRSGKYSLSTDATGNAWTDAAETRPMPRGLNFVIAVGSSNALQDQYLNFITSVEEVQDDTATCLLQGDSQDPRASDVSGSNVGVDSLSMDKANDVSWGSASIREPLAIPGTPTGVVIEELSRTAPTDSITDTASAELTTDDASGLHLSENAGSSCEDKSSSLPGLSLEPEIEENVVVSTAVKTGSEDTRETERTCENVMPLLKKPVDEASSLETIEFSMNVGAENEASTKVKPILEVTVTPKDLLKLTNRSQGSQLSGERVESPVTMMQIVPKSVDEKSERSEEERPGEVGLDSKQVQSEVEERVEAVGGDEESGRIIIAKSGDSRMGSGRDARRVVVGEKTDDSAKNAELPAEAEPKDGSDVRLGRSSTEESSERLSKTYSLE